MLLVPEVRVHMEHALIAEFEELEGGGAARAKKTPEVVVPVHAEPDRAAVDAAAAAVSVRDGSGVCVHAYILAALCLRIEAELDDI